MTRLQPTGEALLTERPLLDDALANLQDDNLIIAEPAVDEYCATLDNYLELSTLLDPILPAHVSSLCALLEKRLELFASNEVNAAKHNSRLSVELPARALYSVIKVRGVKTVSTHLPHTVQNLRALIPTFLFVESHARVHRFWHVRYCVLVWLAVAIRVPFPLHTILDPLQIDAAVRASQAALSETGPVATAAASFSARLLARADAHTYRRSLFEWAIKEALHPAADPSTRTAGLSLLATTFKIAQRDDLQPFIHSVLKPLHPLITFDVASTTVEAHLISKLSQRLALAFLPPRPATWRYSRISRKLFSRNTEPTAVGHVGDVEPVRDAYVSETDAESLEVVIDLLLAGLCHRDTVVRWSAAKGIGRIAARLPFSLALDVITSVTDLFDNPNEARADASWHGACLALAELARRGLLLPQEDHFRISFEVIRKAAAFDVRRGASSVGAHVRDAACYVVWAMARAYARDDVAPFVHVITSSILPVALLDREINCRRAAAAALQECVGRLSELLFADGINLITLADYFSLGDRNAAYLSIAPDVAKLANGTYFHSIVHELWTRKLVHWDSAVRSLSARSLAILVGADKEGVIIRDVIPNLVVLATKKGDMVFRHGAVLGLSELATVVGSKGLGSHVPEVRRIPISLQEKRLLTGRTGDDMRIACCQLIQSLSSGSLDVYLDSEEGRKDAEEALVFLERILGCGKEHMYGPASAAYGSLCNEVIAKDVDWHVKVTKRIVKGISSGKVFEHQRGFALAAGVCGVSGEVAAVLCNEVSSNRDVEVRRNSATSLGIMPESVLRQRTVQILRALVGGMQDYATDDRGDIGSWVREESMKSSVKIVQAIFVGTSKLYMVQNSDEEAAMLRILSAIVEQCCSKIDRTRGIAGSALRSVCEAFVCDSGNERLMKLCDNVLDCMKYRCSAGEGDTMNFSDSVSAFGAMQNLMTVPELSDAVMSGFISSIGGTGHQAKAAVHALVSYVQNLKPDAKERCLSKVVGVIEVRHERLALPALNVLDILLQHEVLEDLDRNKLRQAAVIVKTSWRKRLRDVKRTSAAVSVLGALASHSVQNSSFDFREGTLGRECLEALVIVLGGPIPRLRRITAESLYMVLLEFDLDRSDGDAIWNALCGKVRDTLNVLADTEWEQKDILGARERRNSICNLLNIRIPTALRAEKPS